MIDHLPRFSASCIIKSKHISISDSTKKFLVHERGEFNNCQFISLCENVDIHIINTVAEAPWSNDPVRKYNAILDYATVKTIGDVKCDHELALAWTTAAKSSFKNIIGFSPTQILFRKNLNFPVSLASIRSCNV